ncbi:MAG: DUF4340 domain-containing protein [bacterium]
MNRTLLLVVSIAVLGLGLALLLRGGNRADNTASGLLFPKATDVDSRKIEITSKDGTSVLEKQGDEWVVASQQSFRADAEAVNALFQKIAAIEAGNVVSKSREKRALFEVDSTGIRVRVWGANDAEFADFVLGKSGPDFQSNYVRPSASDNVYLSGELIRSTFDKGRRGWRDRKILSFAAEDATGLRFATGDTVLALAKSPDGSWSVEGDATLAGRAPVIDGVLRSLSRYTTDDFADSVAADTAGFAPPSRTIEVSFASGSPQRLEVGAMKSPTQYWVRRGDAAMIYVVSKGRVETLFKGRDEIAEPKPAPGEAPANAESASEPPGISVPINR